MLTSLLLQHPFGTCCCKTVHSLQSLPSGTWSMSLLRYPITIFSFFLSFFLSFKILAACRCRGDVRARDGRQRGWSCALLAQRLCHRAGGVGECGPLSRPLSGWHRGPRAYRASQGYPPLTVLVTDVSGWNIDQCSLSATW